MGLEIEDYADLRKVAIFPNNDNGRAALAQFQNENRILRVVCGGMLIRQEQQQRQSVSFEREPKPAYEKELPCIVIEYIPGVNPYLDESKENKQEPLPKQTK